jgi:branched-chain amino acid aminotransferase
MNLMSEWIGKNFVLNGDLQPTELFDKSLVYEGDSIYEVIRMWKGRPVFFSDHIERLKTSVKLQRKEMLAGINELRKDVLTLIRYEKRKEVNLKIVFNYSESDSRLVYLIEPVYPTGEQYKKGVKGILFFAERKDPEAKVIDHKLRSKIYNKLVHDGAYEAILVNKDNCITEGSRSNIFFIKNEKLFTAPDEKVLSGITRKHLIDICRENGIDITFTCINAESISDYDCVFMTGTSPLVLPFNNIDNSYFNPGHKMVTFLRNQYLMRAEESIRRFDEQSAGSFSIFEQ